MATTSEQRAHEFLNWVADRIKGFAEANSITVGDLLDGLFMLALNEVRAQRQAESRFQGQGLVEFPHLREVTLKQARYFQDLCTKLGRDPQALANNIRTWGEFDEAILEMKSALKQNKEKKEEEEEKDYLICPKCGKRHRPSGGWRGTLETYEVWLKREYGETLCWPCRQGRAK